jgi:hypothetical protein
MMSFTMTWEILWALILGFWLSAIIQAVVSKEEMSRLLPDDSPRTIASGLRPGSRVLFLLLRAKGWAYVAFVLTAAYRNTYDK